MTRTGHPRLRTGATAPRHARPPSARTPALRLTAFAAAALVTAGVSGGAAAYHRLQSAVDRADVADYLPRPHAPDDTGPPLPQTYAGRILNLLVIGTDLRDEANAALAGEDDSMAADTTILVHLPADRGRVDLVSVPRDSLVHLPACTRPDGSSSPPRDRAMFNSAFAVGAGGTDDLAAAAACTRLTFEANTGVPVDESIVLKMDGVVAVVDALGGVPVDLAEPMHSPKAGLHVAAGPQVFDGQTALAFLRARTGTGMGLELGSDLARIERQQLFLDALAARLTDTGVLLDPTTLMPVLTAALGSMSISEGLADVRALVSLGVALRGLPAEALTPVTVPVAPAPDDPNRVVWRPEAEDLWQRIRDDLPLHDTGPPPAEDQHGPHQGTLP